MVNRERLVGLILKGIVSFGATLAYCAIWRTFGEMYANAAVIYTALMMLAASE